METGRGPAAGATWIFRGVAFIATRTPPSPRARPVLASQVRRCLKRFEKQGGKVDWTFDALRELIDVSLKLSRQHDIANRSSSARVSGHHQLKNKPGAQLVDHAKCSDHYTPDLARRVEAANGELFPRPRRISSSTTRLHGISTSSPRLHGLSKS